MNITESAQNHFRKLLAEENSHNLHLRVWVSQGGTPEADISINFCALGEEHASDNALAFDDFTVFLDKASLPFLEKASIDFQVDESGAGGELCIKAPHLKIVPSFESLEEKIQHVIDTEIAPGLASHGGFVKIVDICPAEAQFVVILQMGGGCQGCGMAQMTLKQGIERTLKERFPEIATVRDVTDHESGENPYY